MSETPETYSAQEAEAEGVRPLSEEDVQRMTIRAKDILAVADGEGWPLNDLARLLAEEALIVLAVVKAERTELERKEAEAAVLRDVMLRVSTDLTCGNEQFEPRKKLAMRLDKALNTTTAGAALLERVRQLEEALAGIRNYTQPPLEPNLHRPALRQIVTDIHGMASLPLAKDQQHQGTGAAGEEE